ncbi:MarR family winged helix-turn-helix transcriptional regulator [Flavisphingomonas formosensis]|uniref:MarR family winged helix-turn-helix transcriptional regulator n=1 Tax=Flavisphingomonas formosensis TaxID=861534 RepID=UPI0012FA2122|nr:MarR family transcriptional regulator [Sphingomonas formosensis]
MAAEAAFSFDDYDNVIGFVVSQAGYQLSRGLADAIARAGYDLRPREFPILNRLHQYGRLTQTDLAALTYKDKPAMSRTIDRLIAIGLVEKITAPDDRRAFLVSLTPAGKATRDAIVPLIVAMLEKACRGLSAEAIATTVATLRTITARMATG